MSAAARPAGQPPDDPGVHVAKEQIAALGGGARAVDVIQNPLDLGAGEICRERQAGLRAQPVLAAIAPQLGANVGGARVLPDDGVIDRLAGFAIPHHGRLALIRHADGGNIFRGDVAFDERASNDLLRARPDLNRVVLDPAGLGVNLIVLFLVKADDATAVVKDHKAGAGGALIEGGGVMRHGDSCLS